MANKMYFALGKYANIAPSLASGKLHTPAYVLCKDNDALILVDENQVLHEVKGFDQASIKHVDSLPVDDYDANTIYICDRVGYLYIENEPVPIFQDSEAVKDYDTLQNLPVINKKGTVSDVIVLSDLDDGCYMVTGQYKVADGMTTTISSDKRLVLVSTIDGYKYVTVFGADTITVHTVGADGAAVETTKYLTEDWIEEKGYATEDYVQNACDDVYRTVIEELAATKLSQLENDVGFLTEDDLETISDEDIMALFDF